MPSPESSLKQTLVAVNVRSTTWEQLFLQVRNKTKIAADPQQTKRPLKRIVQVLEELGCTDAVIEYPYDDRDFTYDYLHDYGHAFNDCGRDCARVHFFRGKERIDSPSLPKGIVRSYARGQNRQSYLGYMVLRPTGRACVGRTIIRFEYLKNGSVEQHVHACARYHTNLCGVDLEVFGAPFMQQDRSSHVCAGVALWSFCYDLHRRYRTPRLFPRQVTDIAIAASPLRGSGHGLEPREIARVLHEIGCTVDCTWADLGERQTHERRRMLRWFVNVAYGYLESNTPVLLGYRFKGADEGHVVVLVGHDLREKPVTPGLDQLKEGQELFDSDYVGEFMVQDDGAGIYQGLKIWNDKGCAASLEDATRNYPRVLEDAELLFLMPGLTREATFLYRPATDLIRAMLAEPGGDDMALKNLLASLRGTRRNLYLQPRRGFKEMLLDSEKGRARLHAKHLDEYLAMHLPRHVYVCDFCDPTPDQEGRLPVRGEVILDATSPAYAREASVLALRVDNYLRILGETTPVKLSMEEYDLDRPPLAPLRYLLGETPGDL